MLSNTEGLHTTSCHDFCRALKAARERKGITLAQISDATKIPADLFAALERNDMRRWPKGLFRRSFFRDYARAIGLPVADLCEEFVRLFPDDSSSSTRAPETTVDAEASDEVPRLAGGLAAFTAGWARIVGEVRNIGSWLSRKPPAEVQEPEQREWVSDARRVGPPRLRVRIKVPR
jgi:transcriptional regulator with XRE-family HTH domain